MRVSDFDYELPEDLVAQEPVPERDLSRLMVLRASARDDADRITHHRFRDLPGLLQPGDLLVINDTQVRPARVLARRPTGGRVELLFLDPAGSDVRWRALVRPARRVRVGDVLDVAGVDLRVRAEEAGGVRVVETDGQTTVDELLARHGRMPLPPYIGRGASETRDELDRERYQTVYARRPGAIAAPTAGLHFTPELLEALAGHGVGVERLTLHVGLGTFRPLTAERVQEHVMEPEGYTIPDSAAAAVNAAREAGGRVVGVGTTVVRALEHAGATGTVEAGDGLADLFVYPGYRFRVIDAMITNFHLPRSTPVLLVAALAGRELLMDAYREAIERGYRFYSYGDAMLVRT